MARLAVAILGGVLGALIPGVGWSIGFLIGNVIGSVLFPPKGPDGPRLTNLEVISSAYGQFINQGFGTVRVPGNMIWGKPIKETKHKQGKGMGGSGGNSYTYSWTGAIAVGRGPITGISRIWADTKLIVDTRGVTPGAARTKKKSLKYRIYKGDETQLPDPAIEADVGAENATAHRGMAYVLFDDIPLEDYGNRVPSFTFEVTWNAGTGTTYHEATQIVGGPLSISEQHTYMGVDWDRDRFFTIVEGGANSGIRKYNMGTMTEVQQSVPIASIATPLTCDPLNGFLYTNADGGNSKPIIQYDPDGLNEIAEFGADNSFLENKTFSFVSASDFCFIQPASIDGIQEYLLVVSIFNDVGIVTPNGPILGLDYAFGSLSGTGIKVNENRARCVGGPPALSSANGWILGHTAFGGASTAVWGIYKVNVKSQALVGVNPGTGQNNLIHMTRVGSINPSDIHPLWTQFSDVGQFVFDETDDTLIFGVRGGPTGGPYHAYIVKWNKSDDSFGLVWKTAVDSMLNFNGSHNQSRLRGGKYAYVAGATLYEIETIRGGLKTTDLTSLGVNENGAQVYDSERDAILLFSQSLGITKPVLLLLSRASNNAHGVGAIIQDFCQQAGLNVSTDVDVSDVGDSIRGYLLNQQSTARGAIEPLAFGFLFDGVEIDYKIHFIKRGQDTAVSITEDNLVRQDDETGRVIDETRQQELELPVSVSIIYMDYDKDYQQNTARATRISLPTPAMYSKNESTTTLPMVMVPEDAKRLAHRAMWAAWTERIQHKYRLSWEFLKYDPTDVIEITLNNGVLLRDRLTKGDVGADFSLEWSSVSERSVQYTSEVPASGGDGFNPQLPPGSVASRYFLMDSPYFRDQDNVGETTSVIHDAGSSYGSDNWGGMIIYKSLDGSSYIPTSTLTSPATWGIVTIAPGDTALPFQFDTVNTVTVSMVVGADNLSSCTRLEALNGQNWGILLHEGTGILEIFCFTIVAVNSDGSYTLSDLRRGLRGTEVFTGTHSGGESFILLEAANFDQITMSFGDLNVSRYFLGVPSGDIAEAGTKKTIVSVGRDKMPWAPGNIAATVAGSDIDITFNRRTRFGGDMVDGTGDVPLFEVTEAYEIDVYDAPGTTVLRTLTATSESVVYLAADITTDFGSIPATLTVAVYQMSATVGRGFGQKHTVDVV